MDAHRINAWWWQDREAGMRRFECLSMTGVLVSTSMGALKHNNEAMRLGTRSEFCSQNETERCFS